jgi:hypothetical protein
MQDKDVKVGYSPLTLSTDAAYVYSRGKQAATPVTHFPPTPPFLIPHYTKPHAMHLGFVPGTNLGFTPYQQACPIIRSFAVDKEKLLHECLHLVHIGIILVTVIVTEWYRPRRPIYCDHY